MRRVPVTRSSASVATQARLIEGGNYDFVYVFPFRELARTGISSSNRSGHSRGAAGISGRAAAARFAAGCPAAKRDNAAQLSAMQRNALRYNSLCNCFRRTITAVAAVAPAAAAAAAATAADLIDLW